MKFSVLFSFPPRFRNDSTVRNQITDHPRKMLSFGYYLEASLPYFPRRYHQFAIAVAIFDGKSNTRKFHASPTAEGSTVNSFSLSVASARARVRFRSPWFLLVNGRRTQIR